jgi:hypothetical protein
VRNIKDATFWLIINIVLVQMAPEWFVRGANTTEKELKRSTTNGIWQLYKCSPEKKWIGKEGGVW